MKDFDFFETLYYKKDISSYIHRSSDFFMEKLERIKNENKNVAFRLEKEKIACIDKIKEALGYLREIGINFKDILIGIDMDYLEGSYLTSIELEKIIEIEDYINSFGGTLAMVAEDIFTLDEIISTNAKIDEQVDYINNLTVPDENNRPLNEFEKFLMAYNFCTNRKYKENEEERSFARGITSVMNSDTIVCVGYANLLKEMCLRLGIECFKASLMIYDKKGEFLGGHANNIICLDGKLYYADACWDCVDDISKDTKFYNHCLIPIKDKECFKKTRVEYGKTNVLTNLEEDKKIIHHLLNKSKNSEDKLELSDEEDMLISRYLKKIPNYDKNLNNKNIPILGNYRQRMKARLEFEMQSIFDYLSKYEYGEAFSYEDFYSALYNINRAEGMNPHNAKIYTKRTMDANERRARIAFTEQANNCFVVGKEANCEL